MGVDREVERIQTEARAEEVERMLADAETEASRIRAEARNSAMLIRRSAGPGKRPNAPLPI